MVERVVWKRNLKDFSEIEENLVYWLSRTAEERVSAVEFLSHPFYPSS